MCRRDLESIGHRPPRSARYLAHRPSQPSTLPTYLPTYLRCIHLPRTLTYPHTPQLTPIHSSIDPTNPLHHSRSKSIPAPIAAGPIATYHALNRPTSPSTSNPSSLSLSTYHRRRRHCRRHPPKLALSPLHAKPTGRAPAAQRPADGRYAALSASKTDRSGAR